MDFTNLNEDQKELVIKTVRCIQSIIMDESNQNHAKFTQLLFNGSQEARKEQDKLWAQNIGYENLVRALNNFCDIIRG